MFLHDFRNVLMYLGSFFYLCLFTFVRLRDRHPHDGDHNHPWSRHHVWLLLQEVSIYITGGLLKGNTANFSQTQVCVQVLGKFCCTCEIKSSIKASVAPKKKLHVI